MLQQLSANTHNVITAFTLVKTPDTLICSKHVSTKVTLKNLIAQEIEGYIKTGEPMDKAGAYGIQGIGSFMVEKVNGSYTNVIGLPLTEVIQELYKLNFNLFDY